MNYYEISEETARTAHSMVHMSDYKPGSATDGYRAAVDEAAALVASKKAEVSPFYHDKLDALLDRYARRLAEWTNAHNRNQASYPSQFISGAGGYNMKKHNKQMAREDTLWKEYDEIKGILSKIKSVGTGPVDLADPHAREILTEQLAAYQNHWMMQRPPTPSIARTKRWMAAPASPRRKKRGLPAPAYSPKATEHPLRFMAARSRLTSCRAVGATSSASPTVWPSWTSGRSSRPSPPKTRSSTAARSSATWRPTGSKSSSTRSPTRRPAASLNPTASAGRLATVHGNASSPEMLSTRLAAS